MAMRGRETTGEHGIGCDTDLADNRHVGTLEPPSDRDVGTRHGPGPSESDGRRRRTTLKSRYGCRRQKKVDDDRIGIGLFYFFLF
jgi:hypothetical protein